MELHGNSNINQTSTLSKYLYCKLIPAAFPYCANIQTVNSSQLAATGRVQNMVAGRQFWRTMTQHCEKSTDCNTSLLSLLCTDMASPCQSHTSWSLLLLTHRQHAGLLHPSRGICKLLQDSKGQTDIAKLLNKYSPTILNAAAPLQALAPPGYCQHSPAQPSAPRAGSACSGDSAHAPSARSRTLQHVVRDGTLALCPAALRCG